MIWLALWLRLTLQIGSLESNVSPILVENVRREAHSIDEATAELHATEATAAARRANLDPAVLLAMAWIESRYEPGATSWVAHGARRTSVEVGFEPIGAGPRFCGVVQTAAEGDWLACLVMRDPRVGYTMAAVELRRWLRVTRGDLSAALRGYGCGFRGLSNGCHAYAERVLARADLLGRDPS